MSRHAFDPHCPDCRPALVDTEGKVLPPSDPRMRAVDRVWDAASLAEQQAWHRCVMLRSTDAVDGELAEGLNARIDAALMELRRNSSN